MWFGRNQKRIKLSRRLKWSIGKGQNANTYFWLIGGLCLSIAITLIIRTGTRAETTSTPAVLGANTTQVINTSVEQLKFTDYEISRGETLFTISTKFNIPTETLAQLNDINPPFMLKAGETIKIPVQ